MERSGNWNRVGFWRAVLGWPFRERRLRRLAKEALAWRGILLAGNERNAEFVAWLTRSGDHVRVWNELTEFDEAAARFIESDHGMLTADISPPTKRWQTVCTLLVVISVACALAWASTLLPRGLFLSAKGELHTQVGKQEEVALDDGTVLHLNTDSKVQWAFTPSGRAITLVAGEVLVKVGRDERPFGLYRGKILVTDRGTSFSVRAQGPITEVTVFGGKVSVGAGDPKGGVGAFLPGAPSTELSQGQAGSVVFGNESDVRVRTLDPASLQSRRAWTAGKVEFRDERLESIVEEFNRYNFNKLRVGKQCLRDVQTSGIFKATDIESFAKSLWVMGLRASRQNAPGSEELLIEGECPSVRATVAR